MTGAARKVVFIGSCSFSGSTALDLIVGTSEGAISLGEIGLSFDPRREVHFTRECGCMSENCDFWSGIIDQEEVNVHLRIFEKHEASVLSDSTKDPFWIKRRNAELEKSGAEVINILLWRHPEEVRSSFKKRGRINDWERSWVNYYKLYFSLIGSFHIIPFEAIHSGDGGLERRLEIIGIGGTSKKFWENETHSLFGNVTAKKSFFPIDSPQYRTLLERQNKSGASEMEHRAIFQSDIEEEKTTQIPYHVEEIRKFLADNDVLVINGRQTSAPRNLKMGRIQCAARDFARRLRSTFNHLKGVSKTRDT